MLPPDTPMRERMLWAGLAAIIGLVQDGPEVGDDRRMFQRLEAACASFGVPNYCFDRLAKVLGFYYYRPWDCYLDRDAWQERTLDDARPGAVIH